MLLDSNVNVISHLRFNLLFENNVKKLIEVKRDDIIKCVFRKDNSKDTITGKVIKIEVNFNSTLGRVGSSVYMQIDASENHNGRIEYIRPDQVLDLEIIKTTDNIYNAVVSVDNIDNKIIMIRENDIGDFQYTRDGIVWQEINVKGMPGLTAYEIALKTGFEGTEEEWLESLKGEKGDVSPLKVSKVFLTKIEAESYADKLEKGSLVAVVENETCYVYIKDTDNDPISEFTIGNLEYQISGYTYLGTMIQGPQGLSAYEVASMNGYEGTEEEWLDSLKGEKGTSIRFTSVAIGESSNININDIIESEDLSLTDVIIDANGHFYSIVDIIDDDITVSNDLYGNFSMKGKKGDTGIRGSKWFVGNSITGESVTPKTFNNITSKPTDFVIGDMYMNTDTGNLYTCTSGGLNSSMWKFVLNFNDSLLKNNNDVISKENIYKEEERVVGMWFGDKEIYQRTFIVNLNDVHISEDQNFYMVNIINSVVMSDIDINTIINHEMVYIPASGDNIANYLSNINKFEDAITISFYLDKTKSLVLNGSLYITLRYIKN